MRSVQLSSRQILLVHTVLAICLGGVLVWLNGHYILLTFLIGPVLALAIESPRRTYLPALAITLGVALVALLLLKHSLGSTLGAVIIQGSALLLISEVLHQQAVARIRADRRSQAFIALGGRLNQTTTPREAGLIIAETADKLIGWDACVLELYHAEDDSTETVLLIDTVDGQRREFTHAPAEHRPSAVQRRAMSDGALLILNDEQRRSAEPLPFGDTSRPSASLMFVPIRAANNPIGTLSIQSYTPQAYTPDDLATLQALADYCGSGLERIRAEMAVRENEARYRAISELTSDYFFGLTILPDGQRVTDWVTETSFTRITGYTTAEFDQRGGWQAIVHPDDKELSESRSRRILAGQSDVTELRIITKSGETRWLRAYSRPYWDEKEQRVTHMLGAIQDITARKIAEESLLQRQKIESLGVLAGGIAHDFNNLLTVIIGNADLALAELPDDSPAYAAITQLRTAGQRAADLAAQMLAYSGHGRFVVEPIALNQLIEELVQLLRSSLGPQLALKVQLTPDLPLIKADRAQIWQLMLNLIVNAAEAIGDAPGTIGVITTSTEAQPADLAGWSHADDLLPGRHICLEISDSGPGMDAATKARIFDPFFSTRFTGRGLGLPVVLGIVRGHRGALDVRSAPGQGTTVTVLLPSQH